MDLNERIRQLRAENKLTARKFGNIFNISESTVSLYESGKRTPNKDLILKMSEYFNITTDYLLGKSEISSIEHNINFNHEFDVAIEIKKILFKIENKENIKFNDEMLDEDFKQLLGKMLLIIIETGDILADSFNTESNT